MKKLKQLLRTLFGKKEKSVTNGNNNRVQKSVQTLSLLKPKSHKSQPQLSNLTPQATSFVLFGFSLGGFPTSPGSLTRFSPKSPDYIGKYNRHHKLKK